MLKISIIIPIYNVEKNLEKCLLSVVNQDLSSDDYEIIVVNDGSTDTSKDIILKYKNQYDSIIYIEQKNQGVSVARNKGLDIAKGEYILFLDGDDAYYPNILSGVYNQANKNDLDLLYLKIEYFDEDDQYTGSFKMDSELIEVSDGFTHQRRGFIIGAYKKTIVENIRFIKDVVIGEDALFNLMAHTIATKISYYDRPTYKYYVRQGSVLLSKMRYSEKAFDGFLLTIEEIIKLIESNKKRFSESQIRYFDRPLYRTIEVILKSSIIPLLSISRYKKLKKVIRYNQLEYLTFEISKRVKYFDKPCFIFFSYYTLKHFYNRIFTHRPQPMFL